MLVGCISQGRTRAEALHNIREAIELCLETDGLPQGYELAEVTVAA
jgi:predicted RNase H-like HicB family nuclease